MKKRETLALFLGMLSGDGCLSIKHNGEGYRDYPIQFYNNDKQKVLLFNDLFLKLFGTNGKICSRKRENRQEIWEFLKHSRKIVDYLKSLGFPEGVKRDILRIPTTIKIGTNEEKSAFLSGLIITDGCLRKNGTLSFHLGSKLFLKDVSKLIEDLIGVKKPVKEFIQREKYRSYQLYLNKEERNSLLTICPRATMVLGRS